MKNTRLEEIANNVIHLFLERRIIKGNENPQSDCSGEVNCLVKKHLDFEACELAAQTLAYTFNSLSQYDEAIDDIETALHKGKKTGESLTRFAKAKKPEDTSKAVSDLLLPFRLITEMGALYEVAFTYAWLLGKPEAGDRYYPNTKPEEKLKPGSILDENRKEVISILRDLGLFEEWRKLVLNQTKHKLAYESPSPD
jgi:hypothetical protein